PDRISNRERFATFQKVLTEEILYPLWDLGWKIGHASRNTREVLGEAKKEIQSKNAILEARIICGSEPLFTEMRKRFVSFCQRGNASSYIKQRFIDERERHNKAGNTIYLQEPDIKNGIGGLRDYQNILWIAHIKYGYGSLLDLEKAKILRRSQRVAMTRSYDFLLRARTELHLQNRRPTDKLNLEQQPAIAEKLGYSDIDIFGRVEAFMKDYYTAARTIYHNCELLKERLSIYTDSRSGCSKSISFKNALRAHQHHRAKKIDGFILAEKILTAENKDVFQKNPIRLIRVFKYMQQYGASPDCNLKFLIADSTSLIDNNTINSPSAAKSFCSILRNPGEVYIILLQMHELGVLGRYLPEFGRLTCMVQHEYYHRYTADMHVLQTIKHLDDVFLKENSIASSYERELRKNDDPLLLYLILLLHDIGKAEGVNGHDVAGARIAKPILERFGIDDKQQEQILFIIRNHLEMARIWQRYDLEDPKTGASFANHVEDPEILRFLYVHTYCDARGTAPTLWNSYKDSMHRILYTTTLES
ncbi:MAG: HD domain-containing protein, partial [Verrucomicrobiota bacterium]|nr:HD domain-containing protein [Verrucomicrobiota bacterium]